MFFLSVLMFKEGLLARHLLVPLSFLSLAISDSSLIILIIHRLFIIIYSR
jgi:hypothetical protein